MILVVGTVRFAEGWFEKVREAMERNLATTRAEDGRLRYAYARDVLDPQLMHVSEAWRDLAALQAHGRAPHLADWRKAVAEAGVIERDLRFYETDEGTPI